MLGRYLSDIDAVAKIFALGDVFFGISGQSNAKGIADYSGLAVNPTVPVFGGEDPAESYETPYPNVQLYTKVYVNPSLSGLIDTGWVDAQPYDVAGNVNMGFELELARYLDRFNNTDDPVRLAKFAVGGASLDDYLNPAGIYLLPQLIAFLKARQAEIGGMRIGGIFWDNGEADATDATLSGQWAANMTTLMGALRAAFGPQLFLVFKRLSSAGAQTYNATVRAQQETYAASDPLSTMIDTDDATLYDGLHYDTRSTQLLGARFGAAMLDLIHPITVAPTTMPYFVGSGPARMTYTTGGTTQPPVKWWGGTRDGDVGILRVVGTKRNQVLQPLVTASGFQLIGSGRATDGTDNVWVALYWCRADQTTIDANGGHMPTVVVANSNHSNWARIDVYRNCVATGKPYDVVASSDNAASYGTAAAAPGGTTVQPNQLIVHMFHGTTASSSSNRLPSVTNASLSSLTLQKTANPDTATTTAGEDYVVASLATGELAAAGDFAACTATYPNNTLQYNVTLSLLGTNSGPAPDISGITVDATSGRLRPADNTEIAELGAAAGISSWTATGIWNCQEPSGNLFDSSGNGLTLTALNSPSHGNVDAGWTAKSVGMTDGSSSAFDTTSASLPDPATNSYLVMLMAHVLTTPAATRSLGRVGSTANQTMEPRCSAVPAAQFQSGAVAIAGTTDPTGKFELWTTQSDVTASIQRGLTEDEVISGTYTALAGKEFRFGRTPLGLAPNMHVNQCLLLTGSNAELPKSKLRKLYTLINGEEPSWI